MLPMTKRLMLAIIFLLPIVVCPLSFGGSELPKLFILNALIFIILVFMAFAKPDHINFSLIFLPVSAIFLITTLATIFSKLPFISLTGTYQRYNGLIQTADVVMLCFLSAIIFTKSDIRRIFATATMAGLIVSVYGIAQHFGFEFMGWNISESANNIALTYRSFATLASPSFLGLYLAMILPLALSGSIDANGKSKSFWYVSLALIAICLVFTYSRAAWIGASLGVTVWLAFSLRKSGWLKQGKWTLIVFIVSIIIGISLASVGGHPSAIERAVSIADSEVGSTQIRFKLWHGALNMIAERPILGWGPSTFRYVFPQYASAGMSDLERQNVSAHNDFLDRASQTGLLGVLAYLGLIVSIILVLRKNLANNDNQDNIYVYAIIGSMIVYFVAVQFGFSSLAPMALWWILIGCLIVLVGKSPPPPFLKGESGDDFSKEELRGALPKGKLRKLGGIFAPISILALIWCFLTVWTFSWLIADIHFRNAKLALDRGDKPKAIEQAEKAIKWNPRQDFYLALAGRIYHEQDKSAFNFCSKAVRANPINPANRALMARAYQIAGQDNFALKEWQTATELDPQWAQAYSELGLLHHKLGDVDSAIRSYQNALDIDPDYASAYNNLGNAYLEKGKIEDAISSYRRALSVNPLWDKAIHNLGIALKLRQDSKK